MCRAIARQLVPRFSHFNQGGSVFGVAGSRSKFAALFAVLMILERFFHLLIPDKRNAHAYRLVPHADARVSRVVVHLADEQSALGRIMWLSIRVITVASASPTGTLPCQLC